MSENSKKEIHVKEILELQDKLILLDEEIIPFSETSRRIQYQLSLFNKDVVDAVNISDQEKIKSLAEWKRKALYVLKNNNEMLSSLKLKRKKVGMKLYKLKSQLGLFKDETKI